MPELPSDYLDVSPLYADELGITYLAHDQGSGEDVLIRVLDLEVTDRVDQRRFRRACGAGSALDAVPGVLAPRRIDFTEAGQPFVVTDPPVASLADRIRACGPVPAVQAVATAAALARALAAAHEAAVLHLDVRPENVVVTRAEPVLLANFGIARAAVAAGLPEPPPTALVHAPQEIFGWETPGPATDVHGLASTLSTMLTGQAPYAAAAAAGRADLYQRVLRGDPPPIDQPRLPPGLAAMMAAMMDPDPAARPGLDEVRERLSTLAGDTRAAFLPGRQAAAARAMSPGATGTPGANGRPGLSAAEPAGEAAAGTTPTAATAPGAADQTPGRDEVAGASGTSRANRATRPVSPGRAGKGKVGRARTGKARLWTRNAASRWLARYRACTPARRVRSRPGGMTLLISACLIVSVAALGWTVIAHLTRSPGRGQAAMAAGSVTAMPAAERSGYQPSRIRLAPVPRGVRITWSAPAVTTGITEFVVAAETVGKNPRGQVTGPGGRSVTFTGLPAGGRYCFAAGALVRTGAGQAQLAAAVPVCTTLP